MNKLAPPRLAALVLALVLAFGAGRLTAPSPTAQEPPPTQPPVTTESAPQEAEENPVDALYARHTASNGPDARRHRVMWEYALRALYEQMYESADDDYEVFLTVYASLYRYLDWARAMAAQSHGETTLAALYRQEALRLWNELGGRLPVMDASEDSGGLARRETDWQEQDRIVRYAVEPLPLAGEWPEQGIRLWSLGDAYAGLLEVDGRQTVLPMYMGELWRSPPRVLRADLDGDGLEEIAVVSTLGWGTGVLAYGLCIVTHTPDIWPVFGTPAVFGNADFAALVAPHLTLEREGTDIVASAFGTTVTYSTADWDAPVIDILPALDQVAWVEITERGGFRLHVAVGFGSNQNASPIFMADIEGDLRWDGTGWVLENGILFEG